MANIIQVIEEILFSYDLQLFVFEIVLARKNTVFGDYYIDSIDDDDDQINGSDSEEDDSSCDDDKLLDKRTISVSYISTTPSRINVLTILAQLLLVSKRVLVTIIQYKELAKSLNPLLEIFNEKSLNKERINIIRSSMLDKIIDFLKPWTHVMKRIQSLQVSSTHTVTPTTARVLAVPAASAAVECEFSFTDNTITQKRSKLSPDSIIHHNAVNTYGINFYPTSFEFDRIIVAIKKTYATFSKIFNEHMIFLASVLRQKFSRGRQKKNNPRILECNYVNKSNQCIILINTTNNNDSPVKIEMDITFISNQLLIHKIKSISIMIHELKIYNYEGSN
ncbi:unnamed protein product [Rotaria sordida]|uniref:Uncharacterized protein n=1 Tax=Rotaria sordida TaxID=392033 RepID=A0A815KU48_9BILA|nr:unnamed protein product [Rotaria sordida]